MWDLYLGHGMWSVKDYGTIHPGGVWWNNMYPMQYQLAGMKVAKISCTMSLKHGLDLETISDAPDLFKD